MTARLGAHGRVRQLAASALVLVLTLEASRAAAASTNACRVRNTDSGRTYTALQQAVDAAKPGAHLILKGTCVGETFIDKDLVLEGVRTETSGAPTLSGADNVRVLRIAPGVGVQMRDLVMVRGEALNGGGILNRGNLVLRDVIVRRSDTGDGIGGRGGGVYNVGRLTLNGSSRISANGANAEGGGVYNVGSLTLNGSSRISRNGADRSGGVENLGTLTMSGTSSIMGNGAVFAGGVWNMGRITLNGSSSITANHSEYTGGVDNFGTLTLSDLGSISENYGADWSSSVGGVRNYRRATLAMDGSSSISGNEGGGVMSKGAITMRDASAVCGNESTWGGGISLAGRKGTLLMTGSSSITGNRSYEGGGGVYMDGGRLTMRGASSISGNIDEGAESGDSYPDRGGGLYRRHGIFTGVTCGPGGNINGNSPDDCYFEP